MELIIHYGDLYRQFFEDGSSVIQPRSFIFGQITSYIEIAPTGASGIVAARFLPEGLAPFLPIAVSQIDNKSVSLTELFGEKSQFLENEIMTAPGNARRIKLIEEFLLTILSDPQIIDSVTKICVQMIFRSQGQMGMGRLADESNLNRRNLERKFRLAVGMSPKQLSRLVRLQAALKILEQKKYDSLTSLAHETGYYDQAHFIKDFREFTGVSPKAFYADNLKLSSLFIASE
jgi:AraC-like DNA-binding protein